MTKKKAKGVPLSMVDLYDDRLDKPEFRMRMFEEILMAIHNARTKEGKVFHIDTSRLRHEYIQLEADVKNKQGYAGP